MKLPTPLLFLLLATTLSAQITATNATFPAAGDTLKMAYASKNENVNLDKGALKQPQLSRPAYEHPLALCAI